MLILFGPFLVILLLDPFFLFHYLVLQNRPCIWNAFETLTIPVHCFGTRDTLKTVICLSISRALFLFFCHFHINLWTCKKSRHHWSLIINLPSLVFCQQLLLWEGIDISRGDPDLQAVIVFSAPFPAGFIRLILLRSLLSLLRRLRPSFLIFRVWIRPQAHSNCIRTICFWIFAVSGAWPILHITLLLLHSGANWIFPLNWQDFPHSNCTAILSHVWRVVA